MHFRRMALIAALFATTLAPVSAQVAVPAPEPEMTAAQRAQHEKDNLETGAYILTMDKITHAYAMAHELALLAKSNPTVKAHLDKMARSEGTIDEMTAIRAGWSDIVAIQAKHGFTPRESVVFEIAYFDGTLATSAIGNGADRAELISETHINPDNIDFLNQHEAEIKTLDAKFPTEGSSTLPASQP
jgi:hypothetical protein